MFKHSILVCIASLLSLGAVAQTKRQMVLQNSVDGQSQLTVYLPANPTGRAVVCCPGGGYSHLALNHEGHDWAGYFNEKGIAFAVLKYRMPHGNRELPLADAYQAITTMRDSATVWGINPYDVGIMGFSAGGHLASSVCTHGDGKTRPDFAILFYPVITMGEGTHKGSKANFLGEQRQLAPSLIRQWSNETQVQSGLTPPTILLMTGDDRVVPPLENGIAYYAALQRAGISSALHVYPVGGHGFGFRSAFGSHYLMLHDLSTWLNQLPMARQSR